MRFRRLLYIYLFFLLLPPLLCACANGDKKESETERGQGYTVAVMLIPCDGMIVESENPLRVAPGEDAVFSVTVRDDLELSFSGGADYYDGKVTIPGVLMPITVTVSASNKALSSDITEVIENNTAAPVGAEELLAKELTATEGNFLVVYHANGGVLRAPVTKSMTTYGSGTLAVESSAEFYLCPNALLNKGYFTREGYALLGYNTMPDGSGDFYACGWNIIMPDSGAIDLYVMWIEETPYKEFSFRVSAGKATVVKYNGNSDIVVIPLYYGDVPVTTVATGAFISAQCSEIYLPREIKTVENNAFSDCDKLTTLYISDNITLIRDTSFQNCKKLSTLIISAVRDPVYPTNKHGTYAVKYELLYTAKGRKVLVVCGSNTAYGLDSVQLMEELSFDATVVNFGFNWHVPTLMQMEIAEKFTRPGDILLLAPELTEAQFGGVASYTTMWQLFESCYEAVSYFNIQNYTGVFDTFANFNLTRSKMSTFSYEDFVKDVNIYGDYTISRSAKPLDYNFSGQMNLDFNKDVYLTDERVARMNAMFDRYFANDCYVWMSYASINQNSFSVQSKDAAYRAEWVEALTGKLHVKMISELDDYIYPGNYFFDSNFHLSTEATKIRTSKLAGDMNKAFSEIS